MPRASCTNHAMQERDASKVTRMIQTCMIFASTTQGFFSSPSGTSPSPSSTGLEPLVEDREVEEPWDPCRERNRVESRMERGLLLICGITQNSLQSIIMIKKKPRQTQSQSLLIQSQPKQICMFKNSQRNTV